MSRVLITGITGQDGYYLVQAVLSQNPQSKITGLVRAGSLKHKAKEIARLKSVCPGLYIEEIDYFDLSALRVLLKRVEPNQIYHLAGVSHTHSHIDEYPGIFSANVQITGNLLAACAAEVKSARIFLPLSSHMFGDLNRAVVETDTFDPISFYGLTKVMCWNFAEFYRKKHGMHITCGFLYNHESPIRDTKFATARIVSQVLAIERGEIDEIEVGNVDVTRDWGHAAEFMNVFVKSLTLDKGDDFVIASGKPTKMTDFIGLCFHKIGIDLRWHPAPSKDGEVAVDTKNTKTRVRVNEKSVRKNEIKFQSGDISKAKRVLGFHPVRTIENIVDEMFEYQRSASKK